MISIEDMLGASLVVFAQNVLYMDEEGKHFLSWGVVQGCFMNAQRSLLTRKLRQKWRWKSHFLHFLYFFSNWRFLFNTA